MEDHGVCFSNGRFCLPNLRCRVSERVGLSKTIEGEGLVVIPVLVVVL